MPSSSSVSARPPATLLLVGVLAGCNPFSAPQSLMDEYVERTARVLDQPYRLSAIPPADSLPRRRDRILQMPEVELGMLDFLSLFGCDLQAVAGERASILGRVMQPANRLRYEVRFIEAAEQCLPKIDDEGLKEEVAQAIRSKRENLPIAIWNATWGVEEMEKLFTLAEGPYPVEAAPVANLAADLRSLNHMLEPLFAGNTGVSLEGLGAIHQQWQAHDTAGQLILSARMLVTRLDDASDVLASKLEDRPLCLGGKPNSQSDIVQGMFFRVFIERVQPYLATIRRGRNQIIQPLTTLAERQETVMPQSFRSWYQTYLRLGGDSLWAQLDRSQQRHIELWQRQLEQCGLRPGT
ncbi:Protein of unknown function [Marinobacter daqiaonensis]|uniref:DUF3080 domain-containing protein n=1 Tax=Marinobacter daqiaonensis TaxID=650891 RepID=A0A1I6GF38_9GAMM|nr:DUF3080 domain-containing protein [Marinobacter daqiaonensis]SFR40806.1 Protein of unknown function [Marinobacter daqiaonensis]